MKNIAAGIVAVAIAAVAFNANADCVYGAKEKTSFVVLDSHTIILKGGYGNDILIKTYSFINSYSSITVLKDSFCSYDSAVLYVDNETVDVNQVTKI